MPRPLVRRKSRPPCISQKNRLHIRYKRRRGFQLDRPVATNLNLFNLNKTLFFLLLRSIRRTAKHFHRTEVASLAAVNAAGLLCALRVAAVVIKSSVTRQTNGLFETGLPDRASRFSAFILSLSRRVGGAELG